MIAQAVSGPGLFESWYVYQGCHPVDAAAGSTAVSRLVTEQQLGFGNVAALAHLGGATVGVAAWLILALR